MAYQKYITELYHRIRDKIREPEYSLIRSIIQERKQKWRKGYPIVRVEHPTRIDRARQYGFKAKQGFVVARVRMRKGAMHRARPKRGRRPKRMGVNKITSEKSNQRIAEERCQKKYTNLEVLGSYWVWADGQYTWYEIVMVDPSHPVIQSDPNLCWVSKPSSRHRALKGLTPAGRKGRGLRNRGMGAEKQRPSIKAHHRKGK
ncbi:MAG: 50S ribosomal protein L15e [Candidatus Altiarchaeota archaeon]|nr:50S ribosomal protein L15e [Candidatus Altiarchaeota archaeon]